MLISGPTAAAIGRRPAAKVSDCEGLLSLLTERIDGALLDAAPRLRVVSNYAVGFNNIDIPAATERGIAVGNTPGVLTDATADMAFALLISAGRHIVESEKYAVAGKWVPGADGTHRTGHGRPHVGHRRHGPHWLCMARRCHGGWGMRILYHDQRANEQAERELGAERVGFDQLLASRTSSPRMRT